MADVFAGLLAMVDRPLLGNLGGTVTYSPAVGAPVDVVGIFDQQYQRIDLGTAGVSSTGPAVFLTLADLPSNPDTDTAATVTIAGVTYLFHEVQPDGLGGVVLLLHLA